MAESTGLQPNIPIKGVTIYDKGSAVFDREATVVGNGSINLFFSSSDLSSVSKSLLCLGCKISEVVCEPNTEMESMNEIDEKYAMNTLIGCRVALKMRRDNEVIIITGVIGFGESIEKKNFHTCFQKVPKLK